VLGAKEVGSDAGARSQKVSYTAALSPTPIQSQFHDECVGTVFRDKSIALEFEAQDIKAMTTTLQGYRWLEDILGLALITFWVGSRSHVNPLMFSVMSIVLWEHSS
jgi:hypothetical protein